MDQVPGKDVGEPGSAAGSVQVLPGAQEALGALTEMVCSRKGASLTNSLFPAIIYIIKKKKK